MDACTHALGWAGSGSTRSSATPGSSAAAGYDGFWGMRLEAAYPR